MKYPSIDYFGSLIVSDFENLLMQRAISYKNNISDQPITLFDSMNFKNTKNQHEADERDFFITPNENGELSSRDLNDIYIMNNFLHQKRNRSSGISWGVLQAKNSDFIVPDMRGEIPFIPLTPSIILVKGVVNNILIDKEISFYNRLAISSSRELYFAKKLSSCLV